MPFLRFTRDRRGYENTYVMHMYRRRGKSRSRVLYWFRTPPDVKVGRAALDEDAIRMIEESNPDLSFDWDQILATRPVPEREPRDRSRRPRPATEAVRTTVSTQTPPPAEPPPPPPETPPAEILEAAETAVIEAPGEEPLESADASIVEPPPRPVDQLLDPETLNRLRGRYAQLLARISDRVADPAQRELLRSEADRLNPDAWVTTEEVRQGLEHFEASFEAIRSRLGGGRRGSRRGGRRRRRRIEGAEKG